MTRIRLPFTMTALIALGACSAEFTSDRSLSPCDAERRCADGFTCVDLDGLGPICVDELQRRTLCGRPEECNGRDDDCDGMTDEEIADRVEPVPNIGECRALGERCSNGAYVVYQERVTPTDESCNGRDDDCDGMTDEDLPDEITGVDEGECQLSIRRCVDGMVAVIQGEVVRADETCNGFDDDCDGMTDEGLGAVVTGFSTGECRPTISACDGGMLVVTVVGIEPVAETCDGRDEDCDGSTDEDFVDLASACEAGTGACAAMGVVVCAVDHLGTTCGATVGMPGVELCNDVDDDCDGETDEDFTDLTSSCSNGTGECRVEGAVICAENGFGTTCDATPRDPQSESCNGLDDDCDGRIDWVGDDCCVPDTRRPCGVDIGECTTGEQRCGAGRQWGACSGQQPVPETCNTRDDDCDGETDDGAGCTCTPGESRPCSVTRGLCRAGEQVCRADTTWAACTGVLPSPERCDGTDNDCDGRTDEEWADLGSPCAVGRGTCTASGRYVCADGGAVIACDAVPGTPSDDTCDGADNDCDGATDEEIVIRQGTDTGECQEGIERCEGGRLVVVQDEVTPVAETCDGRDEDCDGPIDEDAPNCCAPGSTRTCGLSRGVCTIGEQRCGDDRSWGECSGVPPGDELCNGIDDDCDGATDEQWARSLGTACVSGAGSCAQPGVYRCAEDFSGAVCDAAAGDPSAELCDGQDNDCDGQTDEAEDVRPRLTGSDRGVCRQTVEVCRGGRYELAQEGVGPSDETCNGLDDDCDVEIDEEIASVECYEGPVGSNGVGECHGGRTACAGGRTVCAGQVMQTVETCDDRDNDCDGAADGEPAPDGGTIPLTESCYTGDPTTLGIGECRTGTTTCSGGYWTACVGESLPTDEVCGDAADSDCDGRDDGITFLEDFEDDCAMPEATVTSDVPLDCVPTPVDAVDPSRTPDGRRSLRVALLSDGTRTQIDWTFASCNPIGFGVLMVDLAAATGLVQVGFNPLLEGEQSHFVYRPNGIDDVAVTRNDGGTTYDTVTVIIDATEWHEIGWSLSAAGEIVYTMDGEAFYSNSIDASVFGMRFFARLFSAGDVQLSIDDVRFVSP